MEIFLENLLIWLLYFTPVLLVFGIGAWIDEKIINKESNYGIRKSKNG